VSKPIQHRNIEQEDTTALDIETRFLTLPKEYLEVICAGKVGKPVKIVSNASDAFGTHSKVYIRIDNQATNEELKAEQKLFAPNVHVARSMRRCQWKLMPILKYWSLVDVVMSKYELVLFEANDIDSSRSSHDAVEKEICVHKALVATKGGKGLLMRDVVLGRKIVGHVNFTDITSVTIDRHLPSDGLPSIQEEQFEDQSYFSEASRWPASNDIQMLGYATRVKIRPEYWKVNGYFDCGNKVSFRWENVTQDRLKIVSRRGTLYLRFLSDLENSESNNERKIEANAERSDVEDEEKSDALIWCQTISRAHGASAQNGKDGDLVNIIPRSGMKTQMSLRSPFILV